VGVGRFLPSPVTFLSLHPGTIVRRNMGIICNVSGTKAKNFDAFAKIEAHSPRKRTYPNREAWNFIGIPPISAKNAEMDGARKSTAKEIML
jgi:hypothetical protein